MEAGDHKLDSEKIEVDEEKKFFNDSGSVVVRMEDDSIEKIPLDDSGNTDQDGSQEVKKVKKVNPVMQPMLGCINATASFAVEHRIVISHVLMGLFVSGFCAYFIYALVYDFSQAIPLVILTATVLVAILWEVCAPKVNCSTYVDALKSGKVQKAIFCIQVLCVVGFSIWLFIGIVMRNPRQLVSLLGLVLIVFTCFLSSKYPNEISWRPVLWGIGLQFILGLLVLRTTAGFLAVKFVGEEVAHFMRYSDCGAKFVFGKQYYVHFFAFKILPMIVFFSTVMNMLYYVGLMQWFIGKLSWLTQKTLGTSAIESTVSVANIFVGMTEAPLVIRPYLNDLTKAEIHSVLTCGLGSIAFSVFGAFVEFGVDPVHLLTACVMSAPAGLAISRLLYPERRKSKFNTTDSLKLTEGTDRNIVEAAAVGASMSIGLVANIAANLIAFLALLAFVNATISWFGSFIGYPDISFQTICGYIFMPLAFLMGADWEDCGTVGELFGMKTFLNEFIAYENMKPYIENRLAGNVTKFLNGTNTYMSPRSEVVAIHALCGFCNVSSLGIIIGGLGSLMPERKKDLAELALRAFFGGILTCCMTAAIASLLFVEPVEESSPMIGNYTTSVLLGVVTTTESWLTSGVAVTTGL